MGPSFWTLSEYTRFSTHYVPGWESALPCGDTHLYRRRLQETGHVRRSRPSSIGISLTDAIPADVKTTSRRSPCRTSSFQY